MVPKLRTKPNTRARVQRAPTKFSELDVTPSRPGEERSPKDDKENLPPSLPNPDDRHHDDHDLGDSFFDDTQDISNTASFAWSDGGSTNVTRRSSPAPPDDCPIEDLWDFEDEDDEALAQLLSQDPKNKNLPDTVPLKEPSLTPGAQIDFSETASTIRRSSPFLTSDVHKDIWDFSDSQSGSDSPSNTAKPADQTEELRRAPNLRSQQIAMDDIYDVTPKKSSAPAGGKMAAEAKSTKTKTASAIPNDSTTMDMRSKLETIGQPSSRVSAKNKRPHQKAKEPIQFDPLTQEIVDVPASRKKNPPPKRSIVGALQESAKALSSPFASTRKTARKQAPKPRKPRVKHSKKNKPEEEVVQLDSPSPDVLESSPVQVPQADSGSAEIFPDLRPAHNENEVMENELISTEVISGSKQRQKEHLHQMSLAIDEASDELERSHIEHARPKRKHICTEDISQSRQKQIEHPHQTSLAINGLTDDELEQPTKRAHLKRRKVSRQISISEKGSPVVTRVVVPTAKADPIITEANLFILENKSPAVAAQRPSFLRTDSGDRLYGRQSDSTLGSCENSLPSRWLRGLDEQPRTKPNAATERNIHDDIRKSFLQNAEPPQSLQDRRPDELAGQSQVHKQISLTVRQLMIHLEGKKSAASNIVEAYHSGGIASVAHMQQQCLYDSRKVVTSIRRHGALFDKNLHAVKEAIKTRKKARTGMAGSLDELLKAHNQVNGRARLGLGAVV